MKQNVIDFIGSKRIAIVGASRSGKKFGNTIQGELEQRGYETYLVHPEAKEINGHPCYPNLAALQGRAEAVLICVPPAKAEQVVRDAAAAGIERIWLQMGSASAEVMAAAREAGVKPVANKCILMYAEPVKSIHGFHRAIVKLFGQL
jgi:uncharacterized protein